MINDAVALKPLMELLSVEVSTGQEKRVANVVKDKLARAGVKKSWMRHDQAHRDISPDFEVGNLIVKLPGTVRAPRRLFCGHLDTVPLCRGAKPVRRGARIESAGKTALGGDNRTAVACIVSVIEAVLKNRLPHPPITALFPIAEEIGLQGSRRVDVADLGHPKMGFNIDSVIPARFIVGAIGGERWEAFVEGISSHAGMHPEHGVSAALIASRAIADASRKGYFGKIVKGKKRGTSNVGVLRGGEATNQVTDDVYVKGECRSHDLRFLRESTSAWRRAFRDAAKSVRNHKRRCGRVRFEVQRDYNPFLLKEGAPILEFANEVARSLGMKPENIVVNGGLDANYLNSKGIPTITLGAGQHGAHTVGEYIVVEEYLAGCRLALGMATSC